MRKNFKLSVRGIFPVYYFQSFFFSLETKRKISGFNSKPFMFQINVNSFICISSLSIENKIYDIALISKPIPEYCSNIISGEILDLEGFNNCRLHRPRY